MLYKTVWMLAFCSLKMLVFWQCQFSGRFGAMCPEGRRFESQVYGLLITGQLIIGLLIIRRLITWTNDHYRTIDHMRTDYITCSHAFGDDNGASGTPLIVSRVPSARRTQVVMIPALILGLVNGRIEIPYSTAQAQLWWSKRVIFPNLWQFCCFS